jgi:hypothetical protein
MAAEKKLNVPLNILGQELRNAKFQSLSSAPTAAESLFYYNSAAHTPMFYNGTAWIPFDATQATNIPISALAVNPLARANHTGTQLSATISDLAATVQAYTLNQFAIPTANVNFNSYRLLNVATPTTASDGVNKAYVDSISTSGNAATATALQTGRTIAIGGQATGAGVLFDGTQNITLSISTLSVNTVTGTLAVANGGTGVATLTGLVKGNGTSAFTAAVAGTDYVAPSGNVATATTATNLAGGAANSIPYQTAAGATGFLTAVNNAVLVTSGTGVPSLSTTLPTGLTIPDIRSSNAVAVSAAGTNQGTGTVLTADFNVVTTVAVGAGVTLQVPAVAKFVTIINGGTNPLLVYPSSGTAIDSLANNVAITLAVGARLELIANSTTHWYSSLNIALNTSALVGTVANSQLTNSSITIGTTALALGASSTTLAGLTSVSSTSFTGALTGNASTATALATAQTFALGGGGPVTATGISFNGTGGVTLVTAIAANALSISMVNNLQATLNTYQPLLGYTPLNKAGDTATNLLLSADPTTALGAATKQYVDNSVQAGAAGIDPKESVACATTANITLSGTQTIDGYAVAAGQRVLVKNQTTASQNGLYLANASAWTRTTDGSQGELTSGALVFVINGTTQAATQWYLQTPDTITVGTTNLTFVQYGAGSSYTNGNGLSLTGTVFAVVAAPSAGIVVTASGVGIDTTVVARKYSTLFGDGTSTSFVITHGLNTQNVSVTIRNNTTNDIEDAYVTCNSSTQVTIGFGTAPAANGYTATVIG